MTWRGRIAREILTGAGYGALADSIIEVVDLTWPEAGQPAHEPVPAHHDAAATPVRVPAESAEYFTIATAAQYLDCSEGLIRKLLAAPDPMPSVTLGRVRRISRVALDAWVARRMVAPAGVDEVLAKLRGGR